VASGRSVERFASGANLGTLTDTAVPAAVTFAPGTHDAAVADPLGAGIVWFRDLTGASDSQVVAAPDDTIRSATAVAFSSDGHSLLVTSTAGRSVTELDLADGTRTAFPSRIVFVPRRTPVRQPRFGTRLPRTPLQPLLGFPAADRIAWASVTAVNKGLLAQVPSVEAGLSAFKAGVYWGWLWPGEGLDGIS
jgi:hypothetical protein